MGNLERVPATLAAAVVAVSLVGCAGVPPEREERDQIILKALEPCKQQYSEYFARDAVRVSQDGRVRYWYWDYLVGKADEVNRCIREATKDLKVGPFAPGRLAANTRPASVSVGVSGKTVVVPVRVNGVNGLMLLSTASAVTYVRPAYAKRAGLEIVAESPTAHVRFDAKTVVIPFVRARAVEVGDASVEALNIAVHEPERLAPKVDGVLGRTFLGHFRMNVDPENKRLTLDPIRQP